MPLALKNMKIGNSKTCGEPVNMESPPPCAFCVGNSQDCPLLRLILDWIRNLDTTQHIESAPDDVGIVTVDGVTQFY